MNETDDRRPVEQRLERVEARLIEQEHRLFSVLKTFLSRKQWPAGDARRRASWLALIWVWFGPMTLAVGGGGATLGVLIWQNWLIREQVKSAERADRNAERTQLIGVLWEFKEVGFIKKKKVPLASPRTRLEALLRFVQIERERFRESGDADSRVDLSGAQLSHIVAPGLDLGDMSQIFLWGADLREANLARAHLQGALLHGVHLEGADLTAAQLEGAILFDAHLAGAQLIGARLAGAELFGARLEGAHLSGAHLAGAIVYQQHPDWLNQDDWTTVPIEHDDYHGRPRWEIRPR